MAKKRVEETVTSVVENNDTAQSDVQSKAEDTFLSMPVQHEAVHDNGLINCLRNERVIVRFVPKPNSIQNKSHVLYGGMAETATRSFVVPRLSSTGLFKNVLTDSEKAYLESVMGLEFNALSIYKKKDNFWDDSNPLGIGRVTLHKQDNFLDLSIPEDYIKYKILLANKDQIAPSLQDLEDHPKATYQFVIISEDAESKSNLSRMDATKRCYMEYGKIEDDADTLRVIVELLENRPTAPRIKLDWLQNKINDYIQSNPRRFLGIIQDELLPAKVLLKKALEAGLVSKRNNFYYLRQDGSPMCELGEESTLNNAAKYIVSPKHADLKYMLEAKVKE